MNKTDEQILNQKIATFKANSTQATNSQRKHIKEIFDIILKENLIYVNEYGYSEISYKKFKKIDKRHYKDLLYWLEDNELIKMRRNLETGVESYCGRNQFRNQDPFAKGYKVLIGI